MAALALLLLGVQTSAQESLRSGDRNRGGRADRSSHLRQTAFEFASPSGAGMTAVCACSTVTGSKGEAMTLARGSNGTCLKNSLTTNIQQGELVTCSSNQPRVMLAADGSRGVLIENATTNFLLHSEDLTTTWVAAGSGAPAAPTITADQTDGPDTGTQVGKADEVSIPATSGSQFSYVSQTFTIANSGAATACSYFVKGKSAGDTTDLCINDGSTWSCAACAFVTTGWNRCSKSVSSGTGTSRGCRLGNNSAQNGGVSRNAVDFYAIGFQGEQQPYPTSYFVTTTATAARSADKLSTPITTTVNTLSVAMTVQMPGALISSTTAFRLVKDSNNRASSSINGTQWRTNFFIGGVSNVQLAPGSAPTSAVNRIVAYYDGTNVGGCLSGCAATSAALALPTGSQSFVIGSTDTPTLAVDGVVSAVCLDPDPSRCR